MKFTTQAGDFYERVSIAAEVASRNEFALAAMTIEADASAQKVTLRCTDLDKSASVECAAEVDKPGKLAVPARLLERIAKAAKDAEEVTLALIKGRAKDSPGQCKVTDSDQGEWKVICIDPSTVVEINIEEDETAVAQLPHDLMRDLQQVVVPCAASDEARPLLCGIETVVREDETLCFTATDSYRLASLDTNPTSKAGAAARAVIPPGPFLSAAKHAPALSGIELALFPNWAALRFKMDSKSEAMLAVKLYAGDYPDWGKLTKGKRPAALQVNPAHVIHAIDRTLPMVEDRNAPVVGFDIKESLLTVTSSSVDLGAARDVVTCKANEAAVEQSVKIQRPLRHASHQALPCRHARPVLLRR